MRTRMYGGVGGRKTKVGGNLLLFSSYPISFYPTSNMLETYETKNFKVDDLNVYKVRIFNW